MGRQHSCYKMARETPLGHLYVIKHINSRWVLEDLEGDMFGQDDKLHVLVKGLCFCPFCGERLRLRSR